MLTEWATQCGMAFASNKSTILTLLTGGLVGGVTHCSSMCGPFVVGQVAAQGTSLPPQMPVLQRLRGAALLPYHLGRGTTYILLGVMAALFTTPLRQQSWFGVFAFALLALAALLFLLQALRLTGALLPGGITLPLPDFVSRLARGLTAGGATGLRGYALGLLLGFLPCGLIYAALMVVAARADIGGAALGMAAFTAGTMPALLLTGLGGQYVVRRWPPMLRYGAPIALGANAFVLFMVAGGYLK